MVHCDAALIITGAVKGTLCDRIYRELGLESLAERSWSQKTFFFHKIRKCLFPVYIHIAIAVKEFIKQDQKIKRMLDNFLQEMKRFESPFFPFGINNLTEDLQKIESTLQFKTKILSFIRTKYNLIFRILGTNGVKLLNHLTVYFSHLNEHKFQHKFTSTIDRMWSCDLQPEATLD